MRDATTAMFPRFAVWENVPGAFSSNKGADFRAVLQALSEVGSSQPGRGRNSDEGYPETTESPVVPEPGRGGGSLLGASWELVTALPGVSMTLSFGEFPSEERESTLSQILDLSAPEKYYLSQKAAAGILRRAKKRGKELPTMLREALMEVAGSDG